MTYLPFLSMYKDLFELKDCVYICISRNLTFFCQTHFFAVSFCGYTKSSDNAKDGAGRTSGKHQT